MEARNSGIENGNGSEKPDYNPFTENLVNRLPHTDMSKETKDAVSSVS